MFQTERKRVFSGLRAELISKRKRFDIEALEKTASRVDDEKPEVKRDAWLKYLRAVIPHQSAKYFQNVAAVTKTKSLSSTGSNVGSENQPCTRYFTEQCFNLLRDGGQCGIVIPSGIYTDLGAKQLREMLFAETQVTGLFGFENRKEIFEGVHRSFKFVVLSFTKGGHTEAFPAAFMRLETRDLELFL